MQRQLWVICSFKSPLSLMMLLHIYRFIPDLGIPLTLRNAFQDAPHNPGVSSTLYCTCITGNPQSTHFQLEVLHLYDGPGPSHSARYCHMCGSSIFSSRDIAPTGSSGYGLPPLTCSACGLNLTTSSCSSTQSHGEKHVGLNECRWQRTHTN